MYEQAVEIARRLRHLIHTEGVNLSFGKELVVGNYYIRILPANGEIYVNDRSTALHHTIFTQKHPNLIGRGESIKDCNELLLFLRTHMVLEDLAGI